MFITKRLFIIILIITMLFAASGCDRSATSVVETENNNSEAVGNSNVGDTVQPATEPDVGSNTPTISPEPTAADAIKTDGTPVAIEPLPDTKETDEHKKEPLEIEGLVLVQDMDPNIQVELRYATINNFTKQKVYPLEICALRKATAEKLAKANKEFMKLGYRIKVWDAYRPVSVQRILWDIVPDSRYVANPNNGGSKHNRGTAVDLTLVDENGNELEMPSGFDDFTGKGSRNNPDMTAEAKKNMDLLTEIMVKCGFTTISTEWWHYNDADAAKYDIIDVDLELFLQGDAPMNEQGLIIAPYIEKLGKMSGLSNSTQAILVVADGLDATKAKLHTYEKVNGLWQPVFEPMDAVLGSKGLTYNKKEGDKESPIGIFPLYRCFGRGENPGTKLQYTQFNADDFWVDDVNSAFYNSFQKGPAQGRWNSAEDLYKIGASYKYFISVEYNTVNPTPGKGSAIFMHIWKGPDSSTAGCTAMSEENLVKIICWLEPSKKPMLLQYPMQDLQ